MRNKVQQKRQDPFRAPEGYFDQLTDRIMSRIPADQVQPMHISQSRHNSRRQAVWRSMAAAAVILIVSVATYTLYNTVTETVDPAAQTDMTAATAVGDADMHATQTYDDEMMDYVMLDHQDVYAMLTE